MRKPQGNGPVLEIRRRAEKTGHATGEGGMETALPEDVSRIWVSARLGGRLCPHCCRDHNLVDAA